MTAPLVDPVPPPLVVRSDYMILALEILLRERNPRPVTLCGSECCHWSSPLGIERMDYRAWLVWHWHALLHQRAREG